MAKEVAARAALVELVVTKADPSPHPTHRWTTVPVQAYFRSNPDETPDPRDFRQRRGELLLLRVGELLLTLLPLLLLLVLHP